VHSELETKASAGQRGAVSMTVGELLDAWLAACAKRLGKPGKGGLEQSTYNSYELQVRTLKATRLASVRLDHLTTRQPIEETYEALEDVLGPARRVQVHKALRSAFNHAMGEGWMSFNPAALVRTRPPEPKNRRATPTSEQVDQAYAIARRLEPDLDVFLVTAALTGLRRQALCGLRWSDVDFESQSIFIRRVVNVVSGRATLVEYAKHRRGKPAPSPKYLDAALAPRLRELQERQARRAAMTDTTVPEDGWLFSSDGIGLEFANPEYFAKRVSKLMRLVGTDSTLHSLRHHRGSKLVSEGVDPAIAARELDHASLSYFLNTYVHPVRSTVDPRLSRIGEQYAIGGATKKKNRRRQPSTGNEPQHTGAS
jgi:integrase